MSEIIATNQTILVVGGGISGVTAALEAAECGKDVVLVEKNATLGGRTPSPTRVRNRSGTSSSRPTTTAPK
jgi:heterodisulfide reductase subunit A-like polyferredoxin